MSLTAMQEVRRTMQGSPLHICILDADPNAVETLRTVVSQLGFTCWGTSDPQEVLEQITNGKCPVVLCDVKIGAMQPRAPA